jgi:hypothetical protein
MWTRVVHRTPVDNGNGVSVVSTCCWLSSRLKRCVMPSGSPYSSSEIYCRYVIIWPDRPHFAGSVNGCRLFPRSQFYIFKLSASFDVVLSSPNNITMNTLKWLQQYKHSWHFRIFSVCLIAYYDILARNWIREHLWEYRKHQINLHIVTCSWLRD